MLNTLVGIIASSGGAVATDYESIATVTVGAGGASSISFSSIPSTYKHLQIRAFFNTVTTGDNLGITLNGSTAPSAVHFLYGAGSSAAALYDSSNYLTVQVGASATNMYATVFDILDYQNTNKNKTVRALGGVDFNGSGVVYLSSGLYATTSAVSSMTLQTLTSKTIAQYSSFALYGIRG